ncbi:hypothetical protein C5U62_29925 [Pseudomonas protegens]|uniref:Uncharacterized protein n=1 Tax=Pseudomonas protegens TaxID=380021 RepID=A0A2T6GD42_9PSED|nr:hypothetical protein [Pseudomonas protegens]PUA42061.1 hypothetical protein C5U62_29925 [Pseudomonas protegens]
MSDTPNPSKRDDARTLHPSTGKQVFNILLWTLGSLILMTFLVILLYLVLMQCFDSVEQWRQWHKNHYTHMLTWRIVLYGTLTVFWIKLKARLSNPDSTRRSRIQKMEILIALTIIFSELNRAFSHWGGTA